MCSQSSQPTGPEQPASGPSDGPSWPEPDAPSCLCNSRADAARILARYRRHGDMPGSLLEQQVRDRGLVTEIVLGVIRNQCALEWMIGQLSRRKPPESLLPVLLVGLYQVLLMDRIEPYAAVHETVEAAKTVGHPAQAGYVNAVLRRALRERDELLRRLRRQPVPVRYSHPVELVRRWTRSFGAHAAARLCAWDNQRPDLYLRIRPGQEQDEFLELLHSSGVQARPADHPGFVVLPAGLRVEDCPGYAEGAFVVQDPATLLAVDLLAPQPGERILDACAAPGGKTIAIADRMRPGDKLVGGDLNPRRLETLRRNLRRCRLDWVQTTVLDAAQWTRTSQPNGLFDGVLLDVPCSNTGVIRRRPDARRRLTPAHLSQLIALQAGILDQSVALIPPGGRIVYSTCSLEPEENEQQVAAFLARRPELSLEAEARRFPPEDQTDGAYAALLRRV